MTPERWQQLESMFHAALERSPEQRDLFLAHACAADPSLCIEVESLIACQNQLGNFIEMPTMTVAHSEPARSGAGSMLSRRIGSYRLIREIGRGGMGAVYLAARDDDQYQKLVAVKIVKLGLDTDFILRRFQYERQILASLDHPNIARLLDGGTTEDGLPYFIMEYIEGKPISQYCATYKLDVEARLKLFRSVCTAIQYAHQNLIVHRDIKPSNILVTDEGVPKLLDFGIAKLLNPEHSCEGLDTTATSLQLMTPEYASPEQARREPITTASDVYTLGVLLYELLTGHRPYCFNSKLPQEVVRVICEEEPIKPSAAVVRVEEPARANCQSQCISASESGGKTRDNQLERLRRRLEGDLDNIVLKALSKEPQRRYSSVEQFSEDIRRHLEGLPVMARKATLRYRGRKFVSRHRAGVMATALIALTLVSGIVGTMWQAQTAKTQRVRATKRFNDVRRLANSFMFEFHDSIANLPGSTPARELMVKRGLEYLDSLALEAGGDPSLQQELAAAYLKLGDVQGYPNTPNLGNTAGALQSYRKALAIQEALVASNPDDTSLLFELAAIHGKLGSVLLALGDYAGQEEHCRKALAIRESLAVTDPREVKYRSALARSYRELADVLVNKKETNGVRENLRKCINLSEAVLVTDSTNNEAMSMASVCYRRLGAEREKLNDPKAALELYRKAVVITEKKLALEPNNSRARLVLGSSYSSVGRALMLLGDIPGALENTRKALALAEEQAAADPRNVSAVQSISQEHNNIGDALMIGDNLAGALVSFRQALVMREKYLRDHPTDVGMRGRLGETTNDLGTLYSKMAADPKISSSKKVALWRQARSWYQRSLDIWTDLERNNALNGYYADKPGEITREIAKCDAATARLTRSPRLPK